MRKFFKVVLVAGGSFLALLILLMAAAAIIIPIKFPPAKLKALATDKLSQTLNRKVSIGDVHFNVFSGFEITQLSVSNRAGWAPGPFLTAGDISISYHLFPLLWGQVSLGQIELKDFQVLVEKRAGGQFNFSDMTGEAAPAPDPKPKKALPAKRRRAALPEQDPAPQAGFFFASPAWAGETAPAPSKGALLVSVDSVKIVHGQMTYLDESQAPAQRSDLKDLNLTVRDISMVGAKTSFELDAPMVYNKTAYHLVVGGSLRYFLASQTLKELDIKGSVNDLTFNVAGGVQNLTGNYAPNLDGSASLDMLKFSGLIPNLSAMPSGLALTGPARVDFHL
ncbi:MAG TPA: AsmA family protein, partial [bacterium]|nr:AsmA family protein [bacterium]